MTLPLKNKKCIPCEKGGKPLENPQIDKLMQEVKGWNSVENKKIEKNLTFIDFKSALGFVNEIGDLAEYEGHHPDINLHNWNKVTITLYTHAVKGLSENDFIMAAKIDAVTQDNNIESI